MSLLVLDSTKIANDQALNPPVYLTAYVSDDMSGSKDLVPTRMQLSWDDPTPVILPDQVPGQEKIGSQLHVHQHGSLVKVSFNDPRRSNGRGCRPGPPINNASAGEICRNMRATAKAKMQTKIR
jgi:hypothetical protein